MANTDRTTSTPQQSTTTPQQSRRQSTALSRRDPLGSFMERFFEDFGFGRNWLAPRGPETNQWVPQVEVVQRGNNLVIRADLPGMKKEDVNVEIRDDAVIIQGERKEEHEEEREGWYRSERTYGSFYRAIPLPEGTIADSAKASFKNGVLEITLQTPPQEVNRGRKINIE